MSAQEQCSHHGIHGSFDCDEMIEFLNTEYEEAMACNRRLSRHISELHAEILMLRELVDPDHIIQPKAA